MSQMMVWRRLR